MRNSFRPYLLNILLLVLAVLLSIAIGAVLIPPGTLVRMLLTKFPGISISANWPETFNVIVYQIRGD